MEYCFIAFEIDSEQNLAALRRAFAAIKKAKEDGYLQAAPEWRSYFTEAQLQIFWSPSPEQRP